MDRQKAAEDNREGKRLVVCVDDFGFDAAVDASIVELARLGRISATGCLVDAPAWRRDAPLLRSAAAGRIGVGLHLNLSEAFEGAPVRHGWGELVLKACTRTLDTAWLRAEVARQLDAFAAAWGAPPDFVDGHRHVHQLPLVRAALLQALADRGWRPWVRCTLPVAGAAPGMAQAFKERVISTLGARPLQRAAQAAGLRQNRRMLGVYGFDADPQAHRLRLERWLAAAGDGDLLMCHTSAGEGATPGDPIAAARRVEHRLLADEAFPALLARHGVRLSPAP